MVNISNKTRSFRLTRIGAVGVLGALGLTAIATSVPGPAHAAPDPGRGNASAQTEAVTPREGSLAVGIVMGEAIAGHQNLEAKAQSQTIDLGSIGTSLTSSDCGQNPTFQPQQLPQPLIVESGTPGADKGQTETEDGGAFSKFGIAKGDPYAKAVTTSAPLAIAGVAQVGGGTATTWSGLVNGVRVAGASVDISGITFPGGVTLSGLHWEAAYPSGGAGAPTGSFTIGKISLGGTALPIGNNGATLNQANAILNTIGVGLNAPAAHVTQGVMHVDPLEINVVPNAARDGVTGPIISGIQPIRQPLTAAVLKAFCKSDTPITVADIAVGSVTGSGSFELSLGGVSATSGEIPANTFNLAINLGTPGSLGSLGSAGSPGTPGTPGTDGTLDSTSGSTGAALAAPGGSAATNGGGRTTRLLRPAAALRGKRGGALAAVSLAGLLLLGALAEGDRRMMRKAQRAVVFED